MISFHLVLHIYNAPLTLVVTQLSALPFRFLIKAFNNQANSIIIKRLPNNGWTGELVTMKFFTKKNIQRLGKMIEAKNKKLIALDMP
jgi:hypothetical protein